MCFLCPPLATCVNRALISGPLSQPWIIRTPSSLLLVGDVFGEVDEAKLSNEFSVLLRG